jgi:hypothetical protein
MGFKNKLKMFFCMIISYKWNLHLVLHILNLMNIKTSQMI